MDDKSPDEGKLPAAPQPLPAMPTPDPSLRWKVLSVAVLCIAALHFLDTQRGALQDLSSPQVQATLRLANLEGAVRVCLKAEPFLVAVHPPAATAVADSSASSNWPTKVSIAASGARPGGPHPTSQTTTVKTLSSEESTQPAGDGAMVAVSLASLAEVVEHKANLAIADPARRDAAFKCAFAWSQLKTAREDWPWSEPGPWQAVFTEGTSLNTVLRIGNIVLLGVFALCVAELLLHALKAMRLPVVRLEDLSKLTADWAGKASGETDAAPPARPYALSSLVGTALVTCVTGAAVVGPELVQQTVNTAHLTESRSLDVRNIQSETNETRWTEKTNAFNSTTVKETVKEILKETAEAGGRHEADKAAIAELQDGLFRVDGHLQEVKLQLAELSQRDKPVLTEFQWSVLGEIARAGRLQPPDYNNSLREIKEKLTALETKQDSGFGRQDSTLQVTRKDLLERVAAAEKAASVAAQELKVVERAALQRGCATLGYFEDLEEKRWLFSKEGRDRIQLLRNMMGTPQPTSGCEEFSRATPRQGPSDAGAPFAEAGKPQ